MDDLARLNRTEAITRRELLRNSLAAGSALLLSSSRALRTLSDSGKSIVVIGAGLSGLAAAYELLSVGYQVTILEARNRISGRVITIDDFVQNRFVEGGGELIGSNHPVWTAYAHRFGLQFLEFPENNSTQPIVVDGELLSASETNRVLDELESLQGQITKDAEIVINENEPWLTEGADSIDRRSVADWLGAVPASDISKKIFGAQLVADNGVALEHQSYLGMLTMVKGGGLKRYWTESDVYHCKGGNQQLSQHLAAQIGQSRIFLNSPVNIIEIAPDRVSVKFGNDRTIVADDVIVTAPPSTWAFISFVPALPIALRPQIGSNVKYLMAFNRRFWIDQSTNPESQSSDDVQYTWELTAGQPDGACAMVGFSGGPASERMRRIPGPKRDAVYSAILKTRYPALPELVTKTRFMNWPATPWTLGSYSFPSPGQVTTIGPVLQKGLHGRLHFAGEYACYKFVGYMEGALNSGVSIARRLADRDGLTKKN